MVENSKDTTIPWTIDTIQVAHDKQVAKEKKLKRVLKAKCHNPFANPLLMDNSLVI